MLGCVIEVSLLYHVNKLTIMEPDSKSEAQDFNLDVTVVIKDRLEKYLNLKYCLWL